ncbi:FTR1 family protein [Paenibacillus aurantiacus]|uniref:FTR1 family protein n=1 Tax=Paenibacillus aurantiacus TaxID=1936118 RepID=A0ABV5KQP1_9BACL
MNATTNRTPRAAGRLTRLAVLWTLLAALVAGPGIIAAADSAPANGVLPVIGSALVDIGQAKYDEAEDAIGQAIALWQAADAAKSDLTADVDSSLAHAKTAVEAAEQDPAAAKQALAAAAKAVNAYLKAQAKGGLTGPAAAVLMIPKAEQLLAHIDQSDWEAASADYAIIDKSWKQIELPIRSDNASVYGALETGMSMIRIALRSDPPRGEQAKQEASALLQTLKDYAAGRLSAASDASAITLRDAVDKLDQAAIDAQAGHADAASGQLQAFIRMWPGIEGEVQLRSSSIYTNIENRMTEAAGYLVSDPPQLDQAIVVIDDMRAKLEPMLQDTRYSALDAGAILLREGMEAILVIGALVAYLNKSGNADKRKWIWSGAGTGIALSAAMAIALTLVFSQAGAGAMRERIEGFAGLAAVVFMLLVGNWLHNKSNVQAWNAFIDRQVGGALARGSLWSLFVVAALSIFREGAETAIFYVGMAPSIAMSQLVLGIAGALALLLILAFAMIKYSVKLPLRPFFLVASAFIYLLVFRFIGESVHSLQVASIVPGHALPDAPALSALGIYPTAETLALQGLLLLYLLIRYLARYAGSARKSVPQ